MMIELIIMLLVFPQHQSEPQTVDKTVAMMKTASPEDLPSLFYKLAASKQVSESDISELCLFLSDFRLAITNVFLSETPTVSRFAADALVDIGESAIPGVLKVATESQDIKTQRVALLTLGRIGHPSAVTQKKIETLIAAAPESCEVLSCAIFALGKTAKNHESAIQTLLAIPRDGEWFVRKGIAKALGEVGSGSNSSIAVLILLTKDQDTRVQEVATKSLGNIARGNRDAILRLEEIVNFEKEFLSSEASKAIEQIKGANTKVRGREP